MISSVAAYLKLRSPLNLVIATVLIVETLTRCSNWPRSQVHPDVSHMLEKTVNGLVRIGMMDRALITAPWVSFELFQGVDAGHQVARAVLKALFVSSVRVSTTRC
jgi:hypothetical protein